MELSALRRALVLLALVVEILQETCWLRRFLGRCAEGRELELDVDVLFSLGLITKYCLYDFVLPLKLMNFAYCTDRESFSTDSALRTTLQCLSPSPPLPSQYGRHSSDLLGLAHPLPTMGIARKASNLLLRSIGFTGAGCVVWTAAVEEVPWRRGSAVDSTHLSW